MVWFSLGFGAIALVFVSLLCFSLHSHFEPPREAAREIFSVTAMKAKLGEEAKQLDEMPPLLVEAFVAVQEPRFYEYQGGTDWVGVYRSFCHRYGRPNAIGLGLAHWIMIDHSSRPGLHRQAFIRQFIAAEIEKSLSKEEILFYALNARRFGEFTRGAVAGSKLHYGKSLDKLNEDELISLALITLNPEHRKPPFPQVLLDSTRERALEIRNR